MRRRKDALRLQQMGTIDHLAVEARHTDTRGGSERCHHASRVLALRRGGCKRGIDGGDLLRVDGQLAAEAVAAGAFQLTLQPGRVAQVGVHPIDGLNTQRRGGEQAGGARQLKGECEGTAPIALG